MTADDIPPLLLIADLARVLRTSERTIRRRRAAGTLGIPELPSIDRKPRWSGQDVRRFLRLLPPLKTKSPR
jgi:hypothetical protein